MRLLVCATALSATALCALAIPADATSTKTVYGCAWSTGATGIRITPMAATYRKPLHTFKAVPGAKELRLDYAKAAFRRVTVACDLKETEGARGDSTARAWAPPSAEPRDLTADLASGPSAVRVSTAAPRPSRSVKCSPTGPIPAPPAARSSGSTTPRSCSPRRAGRLKLGYTNLMTFGRTTRRCGDGWLAGKPVNADRHGLGKKPCQSRDFTKALKSVGHPVLVQVDYVPHVQRTLRVREVFGDA